MVSKSKLAIELSKLKVFENPSIKDEQYSTDSEIAASWTFNSYLIGDIENKEIADFGSGTGILGIACLLLGAKKVYFIEKDENAIKILKQNIKEINNKYQIKEFEIIKDKIQNFDKKVDLIIMNPPFGTKQKHADKIFLEKAFKNCDLIYSMHKSSTEIFVKAISLDFNFKITHRWNFNFPIKATHKFHKKKIQRINVSVFRLKK